MGEMGQQASPEEQRAYDEFVSRGMLLIYNRKFLPSVLEMLQGNGDPVEGLATAAAQITKRVASSAKGAGKEIPPDVVFHGGTELFEDLASLSKDAGIKDFSTDQDAFEAAYFRALDQYRMSSQQDGSADQQGAQADLAKLQEMDQSGALEKTLMQMAEKDAAGSRPAGQEPSGGLMQRGRMN